MDSRLFVELHRKFSAQPLFFGDVDRGPSRPYLIFNRNEEVDQGLGAQNGLGSGLAAESENMRVVLESSESMHDTLSLVLPRDHGSGIHRNDSAARVQLRNSWPVGNAPFCRHPHHTLLNAMCCAGFFY